MIRQRELIDKNEELMTVTQSHVFTETPNTHTDRYHFVRTFDQIKKETLHSTHSTKIQGLNTDIQSVAPDKEKGKPSDSPRKYMKDKF